MFPNKVNHYANGIKGEKMAGIFLLLVVSCHSTVPDAKKLEAQLEKDEKVKAIITQLREDCDSNIYQMARAKADSTIAARNKIKRKNRRFW